jgi:hypothetical protein
LREQYFEATHQTSPAAVISGYGFEVQEAHSKASILEDLSAFLEPTNPIQVIQIETAQDENAVVLDQFFTFLKTNA